MNVMHVRPLVTYNSSPRLESPVLVYHGIAPDHEHRDQHSTRRWDHVEE